MLAGFVSKLCTLLQYIIFQQIGTTWKADSFKGLMNFSFILFEKVAVHFPVLIEVYIDAYAEMIAAELREIPATASSVLVIGSGSIPVTAIVLARKRPFHITAIDIDVTAVIAAKKVIQSLKLDEQISIMQDDGCTHSLDEYDVIFLLYGVAQQEMVLNRYEENGNPSSFLVVRSTSDDRSWISSGIDIKNVVYTTTLGAVYSFVLTAKK